MTRHAWREGFLIVLLALVAAACGSGSSSPGAQPTATPGTQPTPTPPGQPTPTPTAGSVLDATALGVTGTLISVNARQWIVLVTSVLDKYLTGQVVLPPDAGPDAGPLPVPGCPLVDPPPGCTATAYPLFGGETDWLYGETVFETPSGFYARMQEALGPQGEVIELVPFGGGDLVSDVRPGPGPIFFGWTPVFDSATSSTLKHRPVYWATLGLDRLPLPTDGFADGPLPRQSDGQQRIAGVGVDPWLPVVWLPGPTGYTLTRLPLLEGGTRGAALGIDDGRIVGWSDDDAGQTHAVVWAIGDQGYAVRALPVPEQAVSCASATAISATHVVGECTDSIGGKLAVAWTSADGDASFARTQILAPLAGDAVAHVVAISGSLVVGTSSQSGSGPSNVFWRLS